RIRARWPRTASVCPRPRPSWTPPTRAGPSWTAEAVRAIVRDGSLARGGAGNGNGSVLHARAAPGLAGDAGARAGRGRGAGCVACRFHHREQPQRGRAAGTRLAGAGRRRGPLVAEGPQLVGPGFGAVDRSTPRRLLLRGRQGRARCR